MRPVRKRSQSRRLEEEGTGGDHEYGRQREEGQREGSQREGGKR